MAGTVGVTSVGLTAGARAFGAGVTEIPITGGGTVGPLMVENTAGRSGSRAGSTGDGTGVNTGGRFITSAADVILAPFRMPEVKFSGAGL